MSTEQKRNLCGLLIFGTAFAAVVAIVVVNGPSTYFENESARTTVLTVAVAALIAWLGALLVTRPRGSGREVVRDERDRLIADRARSISAFVTNLYLLAFAIGVIETYRVEGSAPVVFFFFMAMSAILVSQLVQGVATLVGYLRS